MEGKLTSSDKVCGVCFDEMYTKKKVGWNAKHDMIIGPGNKFQVLMVRSIATSSIKCPVFYDFDRKMVKSLLFEIIYTLEEVYNVIFFQDSGTFIRHFI